MPRDQVRFIHEARNVAEKGRLFTAARAGHIAVLIGSTQRMGVGTNVQARCIALHHIDCPWRPADIEQRDGRALRQGNQNPRRGHRALRRRGQLRRLQLWQPVERKARFIAQVMRGRLDVREIDDIGDNALSFAEVKALASGDPLILEKAAADNERTRLERLQRAHERNQHALGVTLRAAEARSERSARVRDDDRRPAGHGAHGRRRAHPALGAAGRGDRDSVPAHTQRELGELAGLPVDATSLVRQLEHRVGDLPALADRLQTDGLAAADEAARAQRGLAQPFKHADALAEAITRATQITAEVQTRQQPPSTPRRPIALTRAR